ncbi:ComEA family DNA-binding protein [Demequina aurantiaca]|uniref:ComEA family DNA-binding protein n=1 Tax=Demequina aurantiaca TaxID=676200 RepID=UPI0007823548|nr:ComEA family DNA-binding protein [Demequina aurantiaca]
MSNHERQGGTADARSPVVSSDSVGARWRDGVARQARAVYESAHGNPIADDARGMRWMLSPRAALTAGIVVLLCGVILLMVVRPPARTVIGPGVDVDGAAGVDGAEYESAGAEGTGPGVTPSPGASDDGSRDGWDDASDSGIVVVDVAGHVALPGLRELPAGSRVADAIDAAGGPLADAAADGPNLARVLVDGEQIYVPGVDEGATHDAGAGTAAVHGKINVNRSDAAELEALPGVGPVLAQRIEDFREEHGPFASVEDLDAVSGIGPALLARLSEEATV